MLPCLGHAPLHFEDAALLQWRKCSAQAAVRPAGSRAWRADAFCFPLARCRRCLCKLLDGIQDHYTYAQPGIQRCVFHTQELVR